MSEFKSSSFFIERIAAGYSVAFFKPGCPFCSASAVLIQALIDTKKVDSFEIYTLDTDFTNETVLEVSSHFGWKPDGIQAFPSKPQIFINKQLIGGNREFYASNWNTGEGFPQLQNPMRF